MLYREHPPCPPLEGVVACYWTLTATEGAPSRVLPDGALDVLFSFGDPLRRADVPGAGGDADGATIVGAMTRAIVVAPTGTVDVLGVRFRPGEAPRLLGIPALETRDRSVPLDVAWGAEGRRLYEELGQHRGAEARVRVLDRALSRRLDRARSPDRAVRAAVARARAAEGRIGIAELARTACVTPRTLERRFDRLVGVGPKTFCRIARLQALIGTLPEASGPEVDWAGLAADFGYFDQSHLIHDFAALSGLSPTGYLHERLSR